MVSHTKTKESSTRKKIDTWLNNLGWTTEEEDIFCNVITERALTREQNRLIAPHEPDYILYKYASEIPIAIIEAKRKGKTLDSAIKDAKKKYAIPLNINIIFASDGTFVKTYHLKDEKELTIDGEVVSELLPEDLILRFINEGSAIKAGTEIVRSTREELMNVFKWANIILRKEGIREGFDRFIEFANLLFLKLISEMDIDREKRGEERLLEDKYRWDAFSSLKPETMLEYINGTVLQYLSTKYNKSSDVFLTRLKITNPQSIKQIVDKLSELNLINVDSDVKGDAFEYFLQHSVTVGNDLGEYFTPRHIVKLMVELINPQYGEKIYDPTCGTGGFLIQAFTHIKRTCKLTTDNLKVLKEETVFGREITNTAILSKMNMIITGDGHANIQQMDSLKSPVRGLYDVVLANPPYAQTTEYGNLYPVDSNQADPIFLQHIMLSLNKEGRAAVIVPEGVLFRPGADKKVRKLLLTKYNLISVISLPSETFVPYAKAKTYILIFYNGSATKNVWFFDIERDGFSLDERRLPSEENDIPRLTSLWEEKENSEKSWTATYDQIVTADFNLSPFRYKPLNAMTKGISTEEAKTYLNELKDISSELNSLVNNIEIGDILVSAEKVPLSEILEEVYNPIAVDPKQTYETIGVRWYGNGVFSHGLQRVKAKTLNQIKSSYIIYNKLFAWKGSFDIVGEQFDGYLASNEFPTFKIKNNKWNVEPEWIKYFFRIPSSWDWAGQLSLGTTKTSRNRLKQKDFLSLKIPVPEERERKKIINAISKIEKVSKLFGRSNIIASDLFTGWNSRNFGNIKSDDKEDSEKSKRNSKNSDF